MENTYVRNASEFIYYLIKSTFLIRKVNTLYINLLNI
jgi:hypothetical protein